MARTIIAGIDIGSHHIKVVIAESTSARSSTHPTILGTGLSESKGLRHGYIINVPDTTRAILSAVRQAEKTAGVKIKKAYLALGGVGLEEVRSGAEISITRGDSEVTAFDLEKVLTESERRIKDKVINRKVLHAIPLLYRIDGEMVLGRAQGLRGRKLSVESLFITCLEQHLQDLIRAVEGAHIEVEDVMASPLAASFVTLTTAQKLAGCVLANIGAETVSLAVFENGIPLSVKIFPVGSKDITHDIALSLKISLEEAEQLKLGAIIGTEVPRKRLDDIITARLKDIFALVEDHLRKIGKNGLLPAGVILTGGGTGLATMQDLARAVLKLPSRTGTIVNVRGERSVTRPIVKDSSWAVAYGLCIWGLTGESESEGMRLAKRTGTAILEWVRQFLP
jgi:cell division protein FtsA